MHAESENVRLKAAINWLDRAGFRPVKRQEVQHTSRSVEEVESELMSLVGRELGELLLGKKKAVIN